jgi:hypothetical protein
MNIRRIPVITIVHAIIGIAFREEYNALTVDGDNLCLHREHKSISAHFPHK